MCSYVQQKPLCYARRTRLDGICPDERVGNVLAAGNSKVAQQKIEVALVRCMLCIQRRGGACMVMGRYVRMRALMRAFAGQKLGSHRPQSFTGEPGCVFTVPFPS